MLDFLGGIRGEYLHPMVITYAINNRGCEQASEDAVRWVLEKMEKSGKIKRRKQYGIRGHISYHYAGLEKGDMDGSKV